MVFTMDDDFTGESTRNDYHYGEPKLSGQTVTVQCETYRDGFASKKGTQGVEWTFKIISCPDKPEYEGKKIKQILWLTPKTKGMFVRLFKIFGYEMPKAGAKVRIEPAYIVGRYAHNLEFEWDKQWNKNELVGWEYPDETEPFPGTLTDEEIAALQENRNTYGEPEAAPSSDSSPDTSGF
jgi:hypothetical protein